MNSIDVVVPCYNYGRYLEACVDSVLSQRDVGVRVLIIDDQSSDNTHAVGARLAARDPRVTFRRHEVNQGLIKTANEGIMDWASAPYTLLLSADDALTPGSLARAAHVLNAYPEVGMVYGMATLIAGDEMPHATIATPVPTYKIVDGSRFIQFNCLHACPVPSPTAVARTKLLRQSGGYCLNLPHASDMEMWMILATLGSIGVIREVQGYYRIHDTNMSKQHTAGPLKDFRARLVACENVFREWGGTRIKGFDQWITQMKRSFADRALHEASIALDAEDWNAFRLCKAFAEEMEPNMGLSSITLRLQVKQMLGPRLSRRVQSLVHSLRSVTFTQKQQESRIAPDWRPGGRFGWWPDAS